MAVALHITAPPPYQPPQVVGRNVFELDKRQDFTFSSCGLVCGAEDFCQQYRTNFGFCCPNSVLTRAVFNYCGPATTCVEYGVSSVADFFYDSTRSIQYCGSARPSCVTYVYRSDSFTQIFCASGQSGTSFFDTTSSRGISATFVGRTTATPTSTSAATASVVSNTRTMPTDGPSETSTGIPQTSTAAASSGLSTGAVAGIGVGAALGGIGLAIGAFFLWRRSNNKKKAAAAGAGDPNLPPQPPMTNNQQGYNNNPNNPGYYQQQQPYAQLPQGHTEMDGAGAIGGQGGPDYYKGTYPPPVSQGNVPVPQQHQQQPPTVYELGGGGQAPQAPQAPGTPAPMYHENTAPNFRQELQG